MTFLSKLSKKHYIQCCLAILLTGVLLYVSGPLWATHSLTVSFEANANKNIDYQIFYTQTKKHPFSEKKSVRKNVPTGNQHIVINLPTRKIIKFRLDLGSHPEKVIIKNLKLIGERTIFLKDIDQFYFNQIDQYTEKDGHFEFYSDQDDPYIFYKNNINLKARYSYDIMTLIILSISLFCIFYKLVQYLSRFKIEKHHSRIDIIFLTVFFSLLCIPMSHISDAEKSEEENRMLARKPTLILQKGINPNYGTQFTEWFSDHFFGRKDLINLFDIIKYKLNPQMGNDKVLIGLNNWYFYKLDNSLNNFANTVTLSEDQLKQGLTYLKFLDEWCKKHGKEFYYIIAPDKNKIYGEYFRYVEKKQEDTHGIGYQFINYIHKHSDIKAVYLRDTLLEYKGEELLYYKHDTHWSELGAYWGYTAIMKLINIPAKSFKFTTEQHKGDLEAILGKGYPQDPTIYKKLILNPSVTCKTDQTNAYHTKCKNPQGQKNLYVLGDSFSIFLLPYLSNNFYKIQTNHYYNNIHRLTQDDLQDIKENYDIVILENIERFLPQVMELTPPQNIKD